ncbi:MAG: pyruvate kinase [Bacillota bacterium]|jgi:pyruvate kinase|nr:pyruvate kinase [Bacillota bacterium]
MRKTKIVCTIGPASESPETLRALIRAGMNVARLNFSHGALEEHLQRINSLREAAAELDANLAILLDIQGPKIRVGQLATGPIEIIPGQEYTLTVDPYPGDHSKIHVDYPYLNRDLRPGSVIYIDDGLLELRVQEVKGPDVICQVVVGGELSARKGVSLPGVDVDLPALTKEDIEHIRFGVKHNVDFVAASFVRRGEHVEEVRRIIQEAGGTQHVVAKIESSAGLRNIDEIIAAADAVMVARGDLGVEIAAEEVPLAQRMLIRKCNRAGKPVITATQMLDSMIRNPRPTRAEVTDVANAIFEGTDCVMLSGETAMGRYPVRAVQVMDRIARRMEQVIDYGAVLREKAVEARSQIDQAVTLAACQVTHDLGLELMICSTFSGSTARSLSQKRPKATIFAISQNPHVVRQLAMSWGVFAAYQEKDSDVERSIRQALDKAIKRNLLAPGDVVTIVTGLSVGVPGETNMLQVRKVEES